MFDFIDINKIKNEKESQKSLIQNISKFILELSNEISFVFEKYKFIEELPEYLEERLKEI